MRLRFATPLVGTIIVLAAATGIVYALRPVAPTLSLGVVYTPAVLVIAALYGTWYGIGSAIAAMLAFNFFFLAPVHTLTLADGRNWAALAVYVVSAIIASELAARARRQAAEAGQREREAALLADAAAELLHRDPAIGEIRARADRVLADADERARARFDAALNALLEVAEERERLEQQAREAEALRQSDAIKTTIIHSVSHDFRTPLATMAAALGGLSSAEVELTAADRAELLAALGSELVRLTRLVENLLDLSRLQADAAVPHLELWEIGELVALAVDEVGRERIAIDVSDDLPAARVDATQIQRVLVNLIENAVKFSPPGATVSISARDDGDSVTIEIEDRGGGIRPEEADALLEPFARGQAAVGGAGLGLAIARGFAAANGGSVSLSPREGGGTRASLTLPAERVVTGALR
jgi:two-component system sensor histidine kinase KdpD